MTDSICTLLFIDAAALYILLDQLMACPPSPYKDRTFSSRAQFILFRPTLLTYPNHICNDTYTYTFLSVSLLAVLAIFGRRFSLNTSPERENSPMMTICLVAEQLGSSCRKVAIYFFVSTYRSTYFFHLNFMVRKYLL